MLSDGVKSSYLDITKGVPQGSILGPVLFTIYVNNIGLSAKTCNINLYADDSVMYGISQRLTRLCWSCKSDFVALQKVLFDLNWYLMQEQLHVCCFLILIEIF